MKRTHKAAQKKATGHARINNRISQSNANIGFDAIFFYYDNQATIDDTCNVLSEEHGATSCEREFSLRKKKREPQRPRTIWWIDEERLLLPDSK